MTLRSMLSLKRPPIAVFFIGIIALCPMALWALTPPAPDIIINGHTYTDADWNANPSGTLSAIANDIGSITNEYPQGRFAPRTILTSDLTMYVDAATGSDSNNCLVSHPCLTVQRPFDILRDGYDLAGYVVTVQLANGTYSGGLKLRGRLMGQQAPASLILKGNSSSPSSIVVSDPATPTNLYETGSGTAVYTVWGAMLTVDGVKLTSGFRCIWANASSHVRIQNIDFGNCTIGHLAVSNGAVLQVRGNYTISGSTSTHARATRGGIVFLSDQLAPEITPVITITGSPTIATFVISNQHGTFLSNSTQTTFSGAPASGTIKYAVDTLGLIDTNSSGTSYFPGSVAGSAPSTGGIYN